MRQLITFLTITLLSVASFAGNGTWEKRINLLDAQTGQIYGVQETNRISGQDTKIVSRFNGYLFLDYTRKELSDIAATTYLWRVKVTYHVVGDPTPRYLNINNESFNYVYSDYNVVAITNNGYEIVIDKIDGYYYNNGSWVYIPNAASSPYVPNDIDIRLELRSENVYALDPGVTADQSRLNFNSTTFRANWSYVEGAEWYDLEWVFIDEYSREDDEMDALLANSSQLALDYNRAFELVEPARVRVWGTNYTIDKTFPEGTLYFRVRSVSNFVESGSTIDQIKTGTWNYFYNPNYGASIDVNDVVLYTIGTAQEFEPSKNWLYSTSFSEWGKSANTVSFYDGINKNRQNISYNSADNVSLVGENKFDYEGRQTINIIPAPVNGRQLAYRTNFNQAFDPVNPTVPLTFDETAFDRTDPFELFSPTSGAGGAAQYFSINNQFTADLYRSTIPQSKGYVYNQTVYRNDASGRVDRIGGIGEEFRVNGDHAIQTFYGSPTELELKRLFGSNVSDNPDGYRKQMLRDENGQYSVKYYDKRGNLIASALSGNAPSNVRMLEEMNPELVTTPLNDNNQLIDNLHWTSEHTFLNAIEDNPINFFYDLTGMVNQITSQPILMGGETIDFGTFCSTCEYNLTIQVIKSDGTNVTGTPFTEHIGASGPCTPVDEQFAFPAIVLEDIGEYRIIKTLSIDQESMQAAFDDYIAANGFDDPSDYVNDYLQGVDITGCFENCEDYCTAMWQLEYIQEHPGTTKAQAEAAWAALSTSAQEDALEECIAGACSEGEFYASVNGVDLEDPSNPNPQDLCSLLTKQLKDQISPGGIYYDDPNSYYWDRINDFFFSGNGSGTITINSVSYSFTDLQNPALFVPAMVSVFSAFHREGCHLQWCDEWQASMNYGMHLSSAMNQSGWNGSASLYTAPQNTFIPGVGTDPFLTTFDLYFSGNTPPGGNTFNTLPTRRDLSERIDNYLTDQQIANGYPSTPMTCGSYSFASTGSLVDFVNGYVQCMINEFASQTPSVTLTASQIEQIKISMFKGIYDNIKEQMIEEFKNINGCFYYNDDDAVFMGAMDQDEIVSEVQEHYGGAMNGPTCEEMAWANTQNWIDQLPVACLESLGLLTINSDETTTLNFTETSVSNAYLNVGSATVDNLAEYFYAYTMETCPTNTWGWFYDPDINASAQPGEAEYDAVIAILTGTPCNVGNPGFETDPPVVLTTTLAEQTFSDCFFEYIDMVNDGLAALNTTAMSTTGCVPGATECRIHTITVTSSNYPALYSCGMGINYYFSNVLLNTGDKGTQIATDFISGCGRFNIYGAGDATAYIVSLSDPVKHLSYTTPEGVTYSNVITFDALLQDGSTIPVYMHTLPTNCPMIGPFNEVVVTTTNGFTPTFPDFEADCIEAELGQGALDGLTIYNQFLNELQNDFLESLDCFSAIEENFRMSYYIKEYQYTLYYYDLVGNLVQTVPPQGVDVLTSAEVANGDNPVHMMETRYKYNGVNTLLASYTPDGGHSEMYIDKLYRVRFSQNAQQSQDSRASFIKYDDMGRIVESGEFKKPVQDNLQSLALTDTQNNYPSTGLLDYSHTFYDNGYTPPMSSQPFYPSTATADATLTAIFGAEGQENLRNSIGAIMSRQADYDPSTGALVAGTEVITVLSYSYDAHKNVKRVVSTNNQLAAIVQQHKTVDYSFDVLSGNVTDVVYQKSKTDEYRHRYHYDANDRLGRVFTTKNNVQWEMDAKYFYSLHGTLARMETGHDKVQGTDYAYNLQGWLKGMNSSTLVASRDIGKDGNSTGLNRFGALDAFGFQLGYYNNDYLRVGAASQDMEPFAETYGLTVYNTNPDPGTSNGASMRSLYNGNITHMISAIRKKDETVMDILGNNYQYDQLQRIRSMKVYESLSLLTSNEFSQAALYRQSGGEGAYQESYTFDKNGNFKTLKRNGSGRNDVGASIPLQMDDFNYYYYAAPDNNGANTTTNPGAINRLARVQELNSNTSSYLNDINAGQAADNYQYNRNGQLTMDQQEGIQEIQWTRSGKVKQIKFTSGSGKKDLKFIYDPMDRRIVKMEYQNTAHSWIKYTYYAYDALGQVLTTYTRETKKLGQTIAYRSYMDTYTLSELHIYGAMRCGTENANELIVNATISQSVSYSENLETGIGFTWSNTTAVVTDHSNRKVGDKTYELCNHLNNVLVVITDRKIRFSNSVYVPDVVSYNDYSPYGTLLDGRYGRENALDYRYGFQGQEMDDEIKGEGNSVNYEYRMHDPRIGRFFATDPLTSNYPHFTPYQFGGNYVIASRELEGLEGEADGTYLYTSINDENKDYIVSVESVWVKTATYKITDPGFEQYQQELVTKQKATGIEYYDADGSMGVVNVYQLHTTVSVTVIHYSKGQKDGSFYMESFQQNSFVLTSHQKWEITGNGASLEKDRTMPNRANTVQDTDSPDHTFSTGPIKFSHVEYAGQLLKPGSQKSSSSVENWKTNFVGSSTSIDLIKYNLETGRSAVSAVLPEEFVPELTKLSVQAIEYVNTENSKYIITDVGLFALGLINVEATLIAGLYKGLMNSVGVATMFIPSPGIEGFQHTGAIDKAALNLAKLSNKKKTTGFRIFDNLTKIPR